jgi:tetratricopeptide (TPR) repeat protein
MQFRRRWPLLLLGLPVLAFLVYQIPAINYRLSWRIDAAKAYIGGVLDPIEALPVPQIVVEPATAEPTVEPAGPTPTPEPTALPLPASVSLPAPEWEQQDWNNCGPATLSLYLKYYGWEGDQFDISDEVKPDRSDRNVNVDELVYYARNWAGWLNSTFRVAGDIELLKTFLASGLPVMIEKGHVLEGDFWPNDDHWSGHYVLLTGYDDATQSFTYQDTFVGANQTITYSDLDHYWKQFNRVYLLLYLPNQEETVRSILGPDWDEDTNRERALAISQEEAETGNQDPYAWFNLGMNQVYFEDYVAAAESFDVARAIGLPQRMLRYQFGPFFAYYHANRTDDLLALIDYALRITDASEEALIWKGWAFYRQGNTNGAIEQFRLAQAANPKSPYPDQALSSIGVEP